MHFRAGCGKNIAPCPGGPLNPRLLAIAGPLKDSILPLPEGEATLGRDPSNALPIADLSVSRKHCSLRQEPERFQLRHLERRNGTLVNGHVRKQQWLNAADQQANGGS